MLALLGETVYILFVLIECTYIAVHMYSMISSLLSLSGLQHDCARF